MSKQNLISVIIPVYNAEKTIENSVKSVLLSTFKNLEIILVDDGSTDGSSDICDKLSSHHENITVLHEKNGGAARARNVGIEHATGDFISFVDSDDFVLKNYFEVLMKMICEHSADIAVCGHKKVYGSHNNILTNEIMDCDIYSSKRVNNKDNRINSENTNILKDSLAVKSYTKTEALKALLYQRNFISAPWGMISKRELFRDLRFPEGKRAEDMATIYRLFANSNKVVRTDLEMYLYYQNRTSTIYTTQSSLNPDYYDHCLDMVVFIKNNYPEILPAAKSRLFSACFQILSETPESGSDKTFIKKIYDTIKEIRVDIIFDFNGKPRNKIAALASFFSIALLHKTLNFYYLHKLKKLK